LNVDTLIAAMKPSSLPRARATELLPLMERAMNEYGITSRERSAMWLAQVGHESAGLVYFEELASGKAYCGRKDLCNTQAGDGPRFKGRGPIQVTGRCNYTNAERALGLPLTSSPTMAAQPAHGFRISAWWWWNAGCNQLADKRDVVGCSKRINGGTNGLADRQARYDNCWRLGTAVLPAPGPGGGGGGVPSTTQGDRMTPACFAWPYGTGSQLYRAVRGSDQKLYYMGPDTGGKWVIVDPGAVVISGVSITGNAEGKLWISYVNASGQICTYMRNPGGGPWHWSSQGGNVK
jgi:predicted chitinase